MFLTIILFSLGCGISTGVFLPEFDAKSLKPAIIHTLTCPAFVPERPNFNYDQRNSQDVILFKPKPDFKTEVDGIICTKIELTTVSEDFLIGSCRVTRSKRELPITRTECDLAISKYQRGDFLDTNYPIPDCSGWDKHTQEKVLVTVKSHPVKFDPYTMEFIDPIFHNGRTTHQYSSTSHDSTLWKLVGERPPCSAFEEIKGELMYATNATVSRGSDIHLWALGIQEQTFEDACKIKYCGLPGVLFSNGEWFNIREAKLGSLSVIAVDRLDECSGSVEVKTESINQEIMQGITNSYQTSMRLWCLDTLEDLNSGIPIPHYRLSFLTPNAVGLGPVYKIINNSLYTAVGHYKNVQVNGLTQLNVIGTTDTGKDFFIGSDQLSTNKDDGSIDWVNGMVFRDGKWSIPAVDILRNNIHHLLSRQLKLSSVKHTIAGSVLPEGKMEPDDEVIMRQTSPDDKSGNIITSYMHKFTSSMSTTYWCIVGLLGTVAILIVIRLIVWSRIYKLCNCLKFKKSKKSIQSNDDRIVRYVAGRDNITYDTESNHDNAATW